MLKGDSPSSSFSIYSPSYFLPFLSVTACIYFLIAFPMKEYITTPKVFHWQFTNSIYWFKLFKLLATLSLVSFYSTTNCSKPVFSSPINFSSLLWCNCCWSLGEFASFIFLTISQTPWTIWWHSDKKWSNPPHTLQGEFVTIELTYFMSMIWPSLLARRLLCPHLVN